MICAALFSIGDVDVVVMCALCGMQLHECIDGGGVTLIHELGEYMGDPQCGQLPTIVYMLFSPLCKYVFVLICYKLFGYGFIYVELYICYVVYMTKSFKYHWVQCIHGDVKIMYTKNMSTKVSDITKEVACRLAEEMDISTSEFVRIAVEEHVKNMLKSILVSRGFDEVNVLSLLDCMSSNDVRDVSSADDIILAYIAREGHVVEATRDDVERALADVKVIVVSRERGDVITMQDGKEISDDNPLLIVAGYDKELGVLVIA